MTDRETNAELTWPESAGPVHAQLDSTASCSICNDFYGTPLVLPCGHSFCSNCIRSYVSHQQGQAKCPQCRAACDERDLRPNTALRDLVDKLLQARPAYIAALRSHKAGHSRLVKAPQPAADNTPDASSNKRQLRSSRTASAPAPVSAAMEEAADLQLQQSPRKRQRVNGSDGTAATSSSQPASSKSKAVAPSSADVAACPICNRTFKAGRVLEAHVNRCIDNPPPASAAQEVPVMQQQPQQAQRPVQKKPHKGVPQLKVPAKIAFHLFNDRKLRDKLKDVSLPIVGKRKELEDRYNRLRLEVQLAADKGEAASETELVRRAMAKEKTALPVKGFFGAAKGASKGSGGPDAEDSDLPEVTYDSFAALIQATKERDAARKAKQQQAQLETQQPAASDVPSEAEVAAARAALPQATDQSSDLAVAKAVDGQQDRQQHADRQSAEPSNTKAQPAACPAGAQPLPDEGHTDLQLPSRRLLRDTGSAKQAPDSLHGKVLQAEGHDSIPDEGHQPTHVVGASEEPHAQICVPAEAHYRVDLTLDDSPGNSQESLDVDVDDAHSPLSSQGVQDQRALQQLQLLNKTAEPVVMNSAYGKSALSSQEKEPFVSGLMYHQPVVNHSGRSEQGLGPLDDIIEDTDSDLEGMVH